MAATGDGRQVQEEAAAAKMLSTAEARAAAGAPPASGAPTGSRSGAGGGSGGGGAYGGIRCFSRLAMNSYFRNITVSGRANVPRTGPVIVVANHSNQFVDPMQLMMAIPRQISFIMAASSLNKPVVGPCAKALKVVPVQRPQDIKQVGTGLVALDAGDELVLVGIGTKFSAELKKGAKIVVKVGKEAAEMVVTEVSSDTVVHVKARQSIAELKDLIGRASAQNGGTEGAPFVIFPKIDQEKMFASVLDTLAANGCIGIFPEGGSTDMTHLLPLKAGVAIMALGAAARGATDLQILPCGINYFRGWQYRSRVLVEIGKPISVPSELIELYSTDRRAATSAMLENVKVALSTVLMQAPDWHTLKVVRTARRLYTPHRRLLPQEYMELNRRFLLGYEAFKENDKFKAVIHKVEDYIEELEERGLKDRDVVRIGAPGILMGLPVYVYAGWGIKDTMAKALARSNVKVAARDVAASTMIVRTIKIAPIVTLVLAIVATIVLGIIWDRDDAKIDGAGRVLLLVLAFLLLWMFVLPGYIWMSQWVFEQAYLLCKHLKPNCIQMKSPGDARLLRERRTALADEVRKLVQELGPQMGDMWNQRIVKDEEFAAERDSSQQRAARRVSDHVDVSVGAAEEK